MRRKVVLLFSLLSLLICGSAVAAGRFPNITQAVNVLVNGHAIQYPGYLIDGVTYVPLRAVSESLGAEVSWDASTSTARVVQFPYGVEPVRSGSKGVLCPLSIESIREAIVYGQANQKMDLSEFQKGYEVAFVDDWLRHPDFADGDLTHDAVLYTPWLYAARIAYDNARSGREPATAETMAGWDSMYQLSAWLWLAGDGADFGSDFKAYVKQGTMIIPTKSIERLDKGYSGYAGYGLPNDGYDWATFWVTIDPHGLDLSKPLTLLVLDQGTHMYQFTWNLGDLK